MYINNFHLLCMCIIVFYVLLCVTPSMPSAVHCSAVQYVSTGASVLRFMLMLSGM